MHRLVTAVLLCSIVACGRDSTPLPPLVNGPAWLPLLVDTSGNVMVRRMATWVDTAHVATDSVGHAVTTQKVQMDMSIGGLSTVLLMRTEIDCPGQRFRVTRVDSVSATMNGVAMPDSVARRALSQQSGKMTDTTWRTVTTTDGKNASMLAAVCLSARSAAQSAPQAAPQL